MRLITKLFMRPKSAGEFFTTATDAQKIKLMEKAARGANKDQRKMVEEYNRKLSQKTA